MVTEKNIYKVDYESTFHLSRLENLVKHVLRLIDSSIFILTVGYYSGRLSDNYFWRKIAEKSRALKHQQNV